jgi:prepilin-type N-terminal cleavage/methylation domain-containing protein/prepilin-type processing-associated H-X9-DG protein
MSTRKLLAPIRAGFTLIELLAVILIIGILAVALTPMVIDALDAAEVTACQANMRKIHGGVINYKIKYRKLPRKSGVKFFAELYSMEAMENSKTNAEALTCPGVDTGFLDIAELDWDEWWTDLELVTGSYSTYAGRDCKNHPIRKLSGTEPLVCDDNDPESNHNTTTNVLYGDGSVQTFEINLLRQEGVLTKDDLYVPVGPDSPVEDLQKFTLD